MQLKEIDKPIYRKRLNIVIVCFISMLLILALLFGAALITVFGDVVNAEGEVNNFRYNFLGVVLSLLALLQFYINVKIRIFLKKFITFGH